MNASLLYSALLAQVASESYLDSMSLTSPGDLTLRLTNGNNRHPDALRPQLTPSNAQGGTRLGQIQIREFLSTFDIIDHLPNQASGFSATLLKNKSTGEYTLAFRSTEYRSIRNGGDAERDSVRGAAGDVAFNGMAFAQVSSMEKYWNSLLDGTRAAGATPDSPTATDTSSLRTTELKTFSDAMKSGGVKLNVSGYSLGGHLATMFATFHGENVASLYLFNSAGVGSIRDGYPLTAYQDALHTYETFMQPGMEEAALAKAVEWAGRAAFDSEIGLGLRTRIGVDIPFAGRPFIPAELNGHVLAPLLPMPAVLAPLVLKAFEDMGQPAPAGEDKLPIVSSSALHFLVSLFAAEPLLGLYSQTLARAAGTTFPSLQERGFIPADVQIYQLSGKAASGATSLATFEDMRDASDWNIVADSGVRAAPDASLLSVYIENQPTAAGLPFSDSGWGDFGNTHSITLLSDSLAAIRMLQHAQPSLPQEGAESILRAASNLRKEGYSVLPAAALAEHDTLERVVDAMGRLLFGRRPVGEIDWSRDLVSADGVSSFGQLQYRDPFHARIQAIESALTERGLAGTLEVVSLAERSAAELVAEASAATARGAAARYALRELNPFLVVGSGLYDMLGRDTSLALYDPATGTGTITSRWIEDRAAFLALELRLNSADHAYEIGSESVLYAGPSGEVALTLSASDASGFLAPDEAVDQRARTRYRQFVERAGDAGRAPMVLFGADGDAGADPATVAGGADRLSGRAAADRLYGEGGNDELRGAAGDDYLEGGAGDDTLIGNQGSDVLAGGPGYDMYLWSLGDGFDRIVETRESSGAVRGRIAIRTDTQLFVPRMFQRDAAAGAEVWRSEDKRLLLTHGATWVLSFADGEIDLGTDFRNGDFGIRLDDPSIPHAPTIAAGAVLDQDVVGPNVGTRILVGEYGHDRLYTGAVVTLEAALLAADGAPAPGWGLWTSAGPGDDLAIASSANDIVAGGGGADTLVGGPGDDLLDGDADSAPILNGHELAWDYRPDGHDGYFVEFHAPGFVTAGTAIFPELHRDQIVDGADVLHGGGGSDRLYGGGGEDLLHGDSGADVLVGGEGNDVLIGGEGDDRLTGELHGYAAVPFEVVDGTIVTYTRYVASYGNDILDGGAGDDTLHGEGGADVLFGGEGADFLYGDLAGLPGHLHAADVLDGGAGADQLFGQGGDDLLFGGAGDDLVLGDSDVEASFHGADSLYGDEGDDLLIGAGGADVLSGGDGADTLIGDAADVPMERQGDDLLAGGAGDDVLHGLGGSDTLYGDDGDDRLYGDDREGPFAGVADLLDGGRGDDELHGHGGDDRLVGGEGDDRLFGGFDDDVLAGGPGSDLLDGGPGDNVYELSPGDGADRIVTGEGYVTIAFVDGIDLDALSANRVLGTPAGIAPLTIGYGSGDSVTVENLADAERLRIRIGESEWLDGTELLLATQAGTVGARGSDGPELMVAEAAHTHLFAFAGDDLLIGSGEADQLHGGAGDDELYGLGGGDTLLGGEGNDVLVGGPGDDRSEGGAGDDRYAFEPGAGIDRVLEARGEGFDTIALPQGMAMESIRLRRAGDDLVLLERAGSARLFVHDWFAAGSGEDRGIDAIVHDGGLLDAAAITVQVDADRFLRGSAGADTLTGDEFDDIVLGGAGDDLLAGLAGNDRYVYALGDGADRIVDTDGIDRIEFGPGIEPGAIELVGIPGDAGALAIALRIGADGSQIVFDEPRQRRIEEFQFASGEIYTYQALLARAGGLRIEGSAADDVLPGTFHSDALYGFGGNDALRADGGDDLVVGGEGDDFLAGGANHDSYVFNVGDGRDVILEYEGTDEYLLFKGFFTPSGRRAFANDGVVFETFQPLPGPFGETFNISLGAVNGGIDTIRFGEGIAIEDIRVGLDLSQALAAYSWIVPDPSGAGFVPGMQFAEQAAYVLEVGAGGDAVTLLWPHVETAEHAEQTLIEHAPVEQLVFGDGEPIRIGDAFALWGGLTYFVGTAGDDNLAVERVLAGGWLAGGLGNDVYLRPEEAGLGVLEAPGEGTDTIVFGPSVEPGNVRLRLEAERLYLDTGAGRVELRGFVPASAHQPLVEQFAFGDVSVMAYEDLLAGGIEIAGSALGDRLTGTSAYDQVLAGAGNDTIDSGGGDDIIDASFGDDTIDAGPGHDGIAMGPGNDFARGGAGSDTYLFARGGGEDVIAEHGVAREIDTLRFAGDIVPADVSLRRAGNDLLLEVGAADGRVTLREWFGDDAMRVESVAFLDGTLWDAGTLASLAGETWPPASGHAPSDPEEAPPAEPAPSIPSTEGVPTPPVEDAAPVPPASPTPPGPPADAAPSEVAEAPPSAAPAPAPPAHDVSPVADVARSAASVLVPSAFTSAGELAAEVAHADAAVTHSAPAVSESAASAPTVGLSAPEPIDGAVGVGAASGAAAAFETLAAAGFVSPGRPSAPAVEETVETVTEPEPADSAPLEEWVETASIDTEAETATEPAMAAYWRWMHARLDEHLAHTESDDLGAPSIDPYRLPVLAPGDAAQGVVPLRVLGVRDRFALDARPFEGLRDGFARLG